MCDLILIHFALNCRDIVPLGQNKSNFNFNLDEKRVLNFENVVDDSDNVKQDMSIDVYGRKQEGEEDAKPEAAPAKKVYNSHLCSWASQECLMYTCPCLLTVAMQARQRGFTCILSPPKHQLMPSLPKAMDRILNPNDCVQKTLF